MLSDEAIEEFRNIHIKKIGEDISFEKARIKAENFISLYKLICKPVKSDQ